MWSKYASGGWGSKISSAIRSFILIVAKMVGRSWLGAGCVEAAK